MNALVHIVAFLLIDSCFDKKNEAVKAKKQEIVREIYKTIKIEEENL